MKMRGKEKFWNFLQPFKSLKSAALWFPFWQPPSPQIGRWFWEKGRTWINTLKGFFWRRHKWGRQLSSFSRMSIWEFWNHQNYKEVVQGLGENTKSQMWYVSQDFVKSFCKTDAKYFLDSMSWLDWICRLDYLCLGINMGFNAKPNNIRQFYNLIKQMPFFYPRFPIIFKYSQSLLTLCAFLV